jgi:hypothetical protein
VVKEHAAVAGFASRAIVPEARDVVLVAELAGSQPGIRSAERTALIGVPPTLEAGITDPLDIY